jgi:cytochrome c oxidase subunit I+III
MLSAGALAGGWVWLNGLGIDPTRHGYGAAVWTLIGYMGFHVALGAGMALGCVARLTLSMLDSWRCLTLRICLLWWRLTAPVTVVALLLVSGFPHVVS